MSRPSAEVSPKPEEMMTTPRTPARAQSATTSSTARAGTAITARSTGAPIALTRGYARRPWSSVAVGWTG